jgi:heme oxygenase
MSSPSPVLTLLREKTGDIHRRLEERMDAIERLAHPETRRDLVQRYHQFHLVMEEAMTAGLASAPAGEWRRTPLIEADLARLDLSPLPCPAMAPLGRGQAIGALYVLEGSSLGGRVILKDLARRGADCCGLGFLDPHGDAVASRWREVVDLLEREEAEPSAIVDGAMIAFARAQDLLCRQGAAA